MFYSTYVNTIIRGCQDVRVEMERLNGYRLGRITIGAACNIVARMSTGHRPGAKDDKALDPLGVRKSVFGRKVTPMVLTHFDDYSLVLRSSS